MGVEIVAVCLAGHGWWRARRGSWGVWSGVCGGRVERGRLRCQHVDHGGMFSVGWVARMGGLASVRM